MTGCMLHFGCIRILNTLKITGKFHSEYVSLIVNSLQPSRRLYQISQFATDVGVNL